MNWKRISIVVVLGAVPIVAATYLLELQKDDGLRPLRDVLWVEDNDKRLHPPGSEVSNDILVDLAERGIHVETPEHLPMVLLRLNAMDRSKDTEPVMLIGWTPPRQP